MSNPARSLPPLRPIFASPGAQPALTDIVGRDDDLHRFYTALAHGSVMLNEPRRIGKSSLLRLMPGQILPAWLFVHTSVQGVTSSAELVECVLGDILTHAGAGQRLKSTLAGFFTDSAIKVTAGPASLTLRPSLAASPLRALESAVSAISEDLDRDDQTLVIAWDEFPDMVLAVMNNEGADRAGALLGVLRRFREQHSQRIRWIITGSVGLHHVLRKLDNGSAYTTDLDSVPLGPLSPRWAQWLAGCLLLDSGLDPAPQYRTELAEVTDGIPYLLHLLVAHARSRRDQGRPVRSTAELFRSAVGDLDASHQTTHLLTRIGPHYGADADLAESLLDRLAEAPATRTEVLVQLSPAAAENTLRDLLTWLTQDHYLIVDDDTGRYRWRYPALRAIWRQRRA